MRHIRNIHTRLTKGALYLPSFDSDVAEGIPVDNQNFVHLVSCTQLMARELRKCKRLIQSMPVDMTEYYGKVICFVDRCIDGLFFTSLL